MEIFLYCTHVINSNWAISRTNPLLFFAIVTELAVTIVTDPAKFATVSVRHCDRYTVKIRHCDPTPVNWTDPDEQHWVGSQGRSG